VVKSGAQAVFFAGGGGVGTVALWRQLHLADPRLLLLGSSAMASESFTSQTGAAAAEHLPDDSDPAEEPLSALGPGGVCRLPRRVWQRS